MPEVQESESTVVLEEERPQSGRDYGHAKSFQSLPRIPTPWRHPLGATAWILRGVLGLVSLVGLLALAASIPVVNVLALGYLMEVQGRVARTGKLRTAFYLLPASQRLGVVLLAVGLWLLPVHLLAGLARDSWLLAPWTLAAWTSTGLLALASAAISIHLLMALGCGGTFWRFVRPITNVRWLLARWQQGDYWREAHRAVYDFVAVFRCGRLLRLGVIGYAAAYLWLTVPALLFTTLNDVTARWQVLGFVVGGASLTLTLMWLPLLMAHVAAEDRWSAIIEFRTVMKLAARTPLRWALVSATLLACSVIPLLYTAFFKIRIPPHAMLWDLMLVFLVSVVPARVLVGWVYHQAAQQPAKAASWPRRVWSGINAVALGAGVGYYVYFLYLAQTGGELGQRAIWQFHALLMPWPL